MSNSPHKCLHAGGTSACVQCLTIAAHLVSAWADAVFNDSPDAAETARAIESSFLAVARARSASVAAAEATPEEGSVIRTILVREPCADDGQPLLRVEVRVTVKTVSRFEAPFTDMRLVGTSLLGCGDSEVAAATSLGKRVGNFARDAIVAVRGRMPLGDEFLRDWSAVAAIFPREAADAEAERVFGDRVRRANSTGRLQIRVRTVDHCVDGSPPLWLAGLYGWDGGWTGGIGWAKDQEATTERGALLKMFHALRALPEGEVPA